jgi:hypothetical protein
MGGEPSDAAVEETHRFLEAVAGRQAPSGHAWGSIWNLVAFLDLLDRWDRQTAKVRSPDASEGTATVPPEPGA